ncbi:MAG: hypothetical protein ACLUIX_10410 [Oscillospiraceae bacterium]
MLSALRQWEPSAITLIRPANVTIDDPTPPTRQTERNDAQWTARCSSRSP